MFKKFFGESKGIFNKITIIDLISSFLFVLFGVSCFFIKSIDINIVAIVAGILLLTNGVSSIISYIYRDNIVFFNQNMTFGIILALFSIITLFLGYYIKISLGIYLIIAGIQKIFYGIILKKFNETSWIITLIIGILLMIIAIILFFTSIDNALSVTGIMFFGYGLINFVNLLLLRRRSGYFIA